MMDTANGNAYNAGLQRARYAVLQFLDASMVKHTFEQVQWKEETHIPPCSNHI